MDEESDDSGDGRGAADAASDDRVHECSYIYFEIENFEGSPIDISILHQERL